MHTSLPVKWWTPLLEVASRRLAEGNLRLLGCRRRPSLLALLGLPRRLGGAHQGRCCRPPGDPAAHTPTQPHALPGRHCWTLRSPPTCYRSAGRPASQHAMVCQGHCRVAMTQTLEEASGLELSDRACREEAVPTLVQEQIWAWMQALCQREPCRYRWAPLAAASAGLPRRRGPPRAQGSRMAAAGGAGALPPGAHRCPARPAARPGGRSPRRSGLARPCMHMQKLSHSTM